MLMCTYMYVYYASLRAVVYGMLCRYRVVFLTGPAQVWESLNHFMYICILAFYNQGIAPYHRRMASERHLQCIKYNYLYTIYAWIASATSRSKLHFASRLSRDCTALKNVCHFDKHLRWIEVNSTMSNSLSRICATARGGKSLKPNVRTNFFFNIINE